MCMPRIARRPSIEKISILPESKSLFNKLIGIEKLKKELIGNNCIQFNNMIDSNKFKITIIPSNKSRWYSANFTFVVKLNNPGDLIPDSITSDQNVIK